MSRASRGFRLAGMLIRFLLILAVFSVIGFLLWRVFFSSKPPKDLTHLTPNAALSAAYEQEIRAITDRYIYSFKELL